MEDDKKGGESQTPHPITPSAISPEASFLDPSRSFVQQLSDPSSWSLFTGYSQCKVYFMYGATTKEFLLQTNLFQK